MAAQETHQETPAPTAIASDGTTHRQVTFEDSERSKLSNVGEKYDINGDGKLDEAEQQLRNMDKSGRGYLTNEKVYTLMQDHIETQNQLLKTRKVMFALLALVVILALSNLGTSFAAASLAKDTSTNSNEQLTHKSSGEALSTQTTEDSFPIERVTIDETGRRRLCIKSEVGESKEGEEKDILLQCEVESYLRMGQKDCRRMTKNCQRGNTVTVRRMWPTGEESSFNICPHSGGSRLREFDESRFTNHAGEHFYFERDYEDEDKWNCKLHGNAVMQDEGEVCLVTGDCDDDPDLDLRCAAVDSVVAKCKGTCRRYRWAQHRVDACVLNCDHPSCQKLAVVEAVVERG